MQALQPSMGSEPTTRNRVWLRWRCGRVSEFGPAAAAESVAEQLYIDHGDTFLEWASERWSHPNWPICGAPTALRTAEGRRINADGQFGGGARWLTSHMSKPLTHVYNNVVQLRTNNCYGLQALAASGCFYLSTDSEWYGLVIPARFFLLAFCRPSP